MNDFLVCLAGMFAVIAPLGALATVVTGRVRAGALPHEETRGPRDESVRLAVLAPAAALALLGAFALLNGPLLDWLKISPESSQFAAAAAMLPLAARLILCGESMPYPERAPSYAWLVPFAAPMLAGPSSIIAAISYAARFGEGEAILASAIVLAGTAALLASLRRLERVPLVVLQTAARLSGGLLVLLAVEMAVDAVHSV